MMRYIEYRERGFPDGSISISVQVEWPDGSMSHEEVELEPASIPGLTAAKRERAIQQRLKEIDKLRHPKGIGSGRVPTPLAQEDRQKEWDKHQKPIKEFR